MAFKQVLLPRCGLFRRGYRVIHISAAKVDVPVKGGFDPRYGIEDLPHTVPEVGDVPRVAHLNTSPRRSVSLVAPGHPAPTNTPRTSKSDVRAAGLVRKRGAYS